MKNWTEAEISLLLLHRISRSIANLIFLQFWIHTVIVVDRQRLIFLKFCLNTVLLWCATIRYTLYINNFSIAFWKELRDWKKISWYCTRVEICGAGCIYCFLSQHLSLFVCLFVCLPVSTYCVFYIQSLSLSKKMPFN